MEIGTVRIRTTRVLVERLTIMCKFSGSMKKCKWNENLREKTCIYVSIHILTLMKTAEKTTHKLSSIEMRVLTKSCLKAQQHKDRHLQELLCFHHGGCQPNKYPAFSHFLPLFVSSHVGIN